MQFYNGKRINNENKFKIRFTRIKVSFSCDPHFSKCVKLCVLSKIRTSFWILTLSEHSIDIIFKGDIEIEAIILVWTLLFYTLHKLLLDLGYMASTKYFLIRRRLQYKYTTMFYQLIFWLLKKIRIQIFIEFHGLRNLVCSWIRTLHT